MRTLIARTLAVLTLCAASAASMAGPNEEVTIRNSLAALSEFRSLSVQGIPQSLLADAQGVAIVPGVIKVGFVLAGRHGRGVLLVRRDDGSWSNPLFVSLTGGSIGWQAGVDSTDVVLVFRTRRSVDGILSGQKFTLGADASIAAGPVGRQAAAATDPRLQAEILSYSRSRGLFAGVSLGGSVVRFDERANTGFYGQFLTPAQVIQSTPLTNVPAVVQLQALLNPAVQPAPVGAATLSAPTASAPTATNLNLGGVQPRVVPGPAAPPLTPIP